MNQLGRLCVWVSAATLVPAVLLSLPATAQDKKAPIRVQKVLLDNDRMRATESMFKPGEVNPTEPRGHRVTRVLKGSTTIERTHSNGKTEKIEWKEGGVYYSPADNASAKNIGKGEVTIYTVTMKEKK
jgi:mannose-6-phosphate isomerase-like protein (cupin superfamily)